MKSISNIGKRSYNFRTPEIVPIHPLTAKEEDGDLFATNMLNNWWAVSTQKEEFRMVYLKNRLSLQMGCDVISVDCGNDFNLTKAIDHPWTSCPASPCITAYRVAGLRAERQSAGEEDTFNALGDVIDDSIVASETQGSPVLQGEPSSVQLSLLLPNRIGERDFFFENSVKNSENFVKKETTRYRCRLLRVTSVSDS